MHEELRQVLPRAKAAGRVYSEWAMHAQAAAAAPMGGQGWPISLRRYVERAFAQKVPDEKRGALNVALKQIISDAQASCVFPQGTA